MQHQNIDGSDINNSDVRLGNAGGDLTQGDHNTITKIYVDLVGQKYAQWTRDQYRILKKVQQDVEERLSFILNDDEVLIPLRLRDEGKVVSRASLKLRSRLVTPQVQVADLKQAILDVFCRADVRGRLLILGAPGGGKTTTLLTLAKELLVEAFNTPGTTIPIIFELSAWKQDKQTPTLWDWLIAQLQDLFNLQPQEGKQWLDTELLLPLLDGLDELSMEQQRQCIAAINAFAQTYPQVVVCCRVQEYRESGAALDSLSGQICLEPLSDQQIEQYLSDLGLDALWHDIQSTVAMRPMLDDDAEGNPGILRVPLLLSMAAVTYDGQPFANRADLYDAYIEQRLHYDTRVADRKLRGNRDPWAFDTPALEPDWQQTQRTLRWLARQLQQNNTVELLIERIQPSWLETKWARRCYRLIIVLILNLIGGLMGGLAGGLLFGPISGLYGGVMFGPLSGTLTGLDNRAISINPVETFNISMSPEVRQKILESLKQTLLAGLLGGLIAGGIKGGLLGGLIVWLTIWLLFGLFFGLQQDLQLRSHPNQGIWNSWKNWLGTTVLLYPFTVSFTIGITELPITIEQLIGQGESGWVILTLLWKSLPRFLVPGIFGALLFGFLVGGGLTCVQHLCLRFVLWQSGIAPWNLARFLNYCVERKLLQRVGGRYRFLHRELLDHFAGQLPTV